MMELLIQTRIQIQKPAALIFDALVKPEHMSRYFISESTGPLEAGRKIVWKWPEFPEMESVVEVVAVDSNRLIRFIWDGATTVTITLDAQPDQSVVVSITEGSKPLAAENMAWYAGNTEGWANFLACLKAYLEYGIGLRKGAFEFLTQSPQ